MPLSENEKRLDRLAYSVAEVGEVTGLGRTTIYKLMKENALPSIKLGRRRLIKAKDVSMLLEGFA